MKKSTIILLSILYISTLAAKTHLREEIFRRLNGGNTLNYTTEQLTIQGNSTKEKYSNDTTFIRTYSSASFTKVKTDSVFGYHFVTTDSLIHPIWKTPLKTISYYNGSQLIKSFTLPGKNSFSEKEISKIDKEDLEFIANGEILDINYILKHKATKQLKDTIINNEKCYHFSTIKNELDHSLYVSKKTKFPVMLQITTSLIQPFIEEYYYKNFSNTSEFVTPDVNALRAKVTPTVKPLKGKERLPDWKLADTKGNSISFSDSKKYKIIFLSMINCGPCQQAIPAIKNIYNKYNNSDSTEVYVFYPQDEREDLDKYIKRKDIKYPIVYNSIENVKQKTELRDQLLYSYPTMIIVKDNEIKYKIVGYTENYETEIIKKIEKMIANKN